MSQEYYPEDHEKIYPEDEKIYPEREKTRFILNLKNDRSRGKTAKLESIDNPAIVFYCQFRSGQATFWHIPSGNYILTVIGEDRKEYVTVFPPHNSPYTQDSYYEWE